MDIVAGIDGGGTHTRAVLANTFGKVIAVGKAGPSNYGSISLKEVRKNIKKALLRAFEHVVQRPKNLEAIFLGMASVVSNKDRLVIREMVEDYDFMHPKHISVDHDIRISLAGGLGGREGIALIAGTGSSCYGRRADGRDWRAGGWGHLLDDKGSAYDLGRQGLIAAVQSADGRGPDTELLPLLMAHLDIRNTSEIMRRIYMKGSENREMNKKEIASLAPIVTQAGLNGDKIAMTIIEHGVEELALMVQTVADKLAFMSAGVPVVTSGGVINGSPMIKKKLYNSVRRSTPGCNIYEPQLPPILGGALLALQMLGIDINQKIITNLDETMPANHN